MTAQVDIEFHWILVPSIHIFSWSVTHYHLHFNLHVPHVNLLWLHLFCIAVPMIGNTLPPSESISNHSFQSMSINPVWQTPVVKYLRFTL